MHRCPNLRPLPYTGTTRPILIKAPDGNTTSPLFHNLDMFNLKEKPERCPTCGDTESIRKIRYGMPIAPVDESIYSLGGCVVRENAPLYCCVECGWTL